MEVFAIDSRTGVTMARTVGLVLIVLGILAFVVQGISYTTEKEIVDVGPLELKTEEKKTIPLSPVLGGLALVGGIALVAVGGRKG
jgi:Na+-transporting methylmalonyl-CoA/oxaloacetate decarboxylase gamma subunit